MRGSTATSSIGSRTSARASPRGNNWRKSRRPNWTRNSTRPSAALAQANANLEIARISAERWQNLRKSDSVSQQDTDVRVATWHAREADVQAAEANVQRLKEMANFKKLVAPFPGIITVRTVDAGTLITAGSSREIFRLAQDRSVAGLY